MNENVNKQELTAKEILEQNANLQHENEKIKKRLERVIQQGDRQHKQFEKLNERLGSYINVIDDHVKSITTNKNGKITSVSTAFSNTFGFKTSELAGEHLEVLLEREDLQNIETQLQESISSRLPWHGEIRIRSKSSKLIWTDTIITPNFDEENLAGFTFISEDISDEKELKELKARQIANKKYDQSMLEFMSSRSSALLQRTSNSFSYVLWLTLATVAWLLIWANYAELEELTRGSGTLIPAMQVKKVESYDNARVEQILVSEGDTVKKGQLLLKFNNIENTSTLEQNTLRVEELKAKAKRLELESNLIKQQNTKNLNPENSKIMKEELALYSTNIQQLELKLSGMTEKIIQKKSEYYEAVKRETHLNKNLVLFEKELVIKEKMAKEKIISEVEFLQFQRQKNDLEEELNQIKNQIIRAQSSINELRKNLKEAKLEFKNRAKKEYHEVLSEIARLLQTHYSLNDQLTRREVYSPIDGTIKKMYVNTIGEVAQAGSILMEIVPSEGDLIVEVKISPEDIAYLVIGQEAMIKFSAYDFNIYGGMRAKISYISADTILNPEDGKDYYIIHLKLNKDTLGPDDNPSHIHVKAGMVADVDIIHGKKSVMNYILKPILKAKENALTEK